MQRVLAASTALTLPQGWSPIAERTPAAIINQKLRSATVVALTPLRVVHFTRERVDEPVTQMPAFGAALRAAAAERVDGS